MEYSIKYNKFDPSHEEFVGTLLTLANGRMGVRGEIELMPARYGFFLAGIYDYTPIFYRELVNFPRISSIYIELEHKPLTLHDNINEITRTLNLRKGHLHTKVLWRNNWIRYESLRIVHMKYKDLFVQRSKIKLNNFGRLAILSPIELDIVNHLEPPSIAIKHYRIRSIEKIDDIIVLYLQTLDSKYDVVIALSHEIEPKAAKRVFINDGRLVGEKIVFNDSINEISITKYVVVTSNRFYKEPKTRAIEEIEAYRRLGFDKLFKEQCMVWDSLWKNINLHVDNRDILLKLMFYAFHLMQLIDYEQDYAIIPAKGLHGLGYRGHVFWDTDIYLIPFYTLFFPEFAKKILLYRYYMLDKARNNAKRNGYKGAQYPWESADDGVEAAPKEIPLDHGWRRKIRIWTGDEEIHITADVAYAIDYYYNATLDAEFMERYGLEIIFETARYWASRVEFDQNRGVYVIKGVMGPDEYHPHVNNSFYTNIMARHNLELAIKYYEMAKENERWRRVVERLGINDDEVSLWRMIIDKIFIPCRDDGLCEEFEGYMTLKDYVLDQSKCPGRECLSGVSDPIERTQVIKQADVIMAMYLLRSMFSYEMITKNYRYYIVRTTHESSLSLPIYAGVAASLGLVEEAHRLFMKALETDLGNLYGNTSHGLHIATAGGLWSALLHGFLGINITNGEIKSIEPHIPREWGKISLEVTVAGRRYKISAP